MVPATGAPYAVDPGASDPNRLAIIAPTSGTTGTTKLIPLSVGEFDRRLHDLYRYQPAPGTERDLMLVGFTSLWALSQSARTLVAARTLGVASSAEDALRMIDLYQMGTILGSPNQLAAMIAALDTVPASLTSLRLVKCGGGQVTPSFARTIRERLCQNLLVIYGSTEAGRTAMANGAAIDSVPGCVGWVIPGQSLEIVDDAGAPVPAGTVGRVRILIEGGGRPLLGTGIEADTTPDWFYPGDLGHVTDDGMLVIVGRADDVINAGGTKVAPERVEELVAGHRPSPRPWPSPRRTGQGSPRSGSPSCRGTGERRGDHRPLPQPQRDAGPAAHPVSGDHAAGGARQARPRPVAGARGPLRSGGAARHEVPDEAQADDQQEDAEGQLELALGSDGQGARPSGAVHMDVGMNSRKPISET